ncbi:MAG: LPXTG cell wall anchor domain-containing protein [Patescibacteria group bacterium]|nr:LPXTG cell wall anchor domain-containing protein [Patescibacteria group bacterium]
MSGYGWSEDMGWIDFSNVQLLGSLLPLAETGQNTLPILLGTILLIGTSSFMLRNRLIKVD